MLITFKSDILNSYISFPSDIFCFLSYNNEVQLDGIYIHIYLHQY